jgi:HEAT repeat protein
LIRGGRPTRSTRKILRDLYDTSPPVRWAAVRELGDWAVSRQVDSPRVVRDLLRRLAWSLNDESGATGWGAPEAMAEILARIPDYSPEFASLNPGYLSNDDVYLGHEVLDAGALWALGRLGPDADFAEKAMDALLEPFLEHRSSDVRGIAAWAAGRLGLHALSGRIEDMRNDPSPITLLLDGNVEVRTLDELAREALESF